MKKPKKKFKLNVVVTYDKSVNPINYRTPIISILKDFSILYKLDYNIDVDCELFKQFDLDTLDHVDLAYFRSTDLTEIELKKFQKLILETFSHLNPFYHGVGVSYQLQKHLKDFPFPSEFHRPLNFPYIEFHKDGQIDLKLFADALKEVL